MSYLSKEMQFCIKIVWCGKFSSESEFYVLRGKDVQIWEFKYVGFESGVEFESWELMSTLNPISSLGMGLTHPRAWVSHEVMGNVMQYPFKI